MQIYWQISAVKNSAFSPVQDQKFHKSQHLFKRDDLLFPYFDFFIEFSVTRFRVDFSHNYDFLCFSVFCLVYLVVPEGRVGKSIMLIGSFLNPVGLSPVDARFLPV